MGPINGKLQLAALLDRTTNFVFYGAGYRFGCGALEGAPKASSRIEGFIYSYGDNEGCATDEAFGIAAPQNTVTQIGRSRWLYGELPVGRPLK